MAPTSSGSIDGNMMGRVFQIGCDWQSEMMAKAALLDTQRMVGSILKADHRLNVSNFVPGPRNYSTDERLRGCQARDKDLAPQISDLFDGQWQYYAYVQPGGIHV